MASQFSAFAPSGIRFSSRKPHAEAIYEELRRAWGSLFSEDFDAEVNVETFAQAKCLGIAREQLERAGNQANPRHVTELISRLEADYKITPLPGATLQERRADVIAARAVRYGDKLWAIREALAAYLGADLLAVVPQEMGDVGTGGLYPDVTNPHATGPGKFCPLSQTFKAVSISTRVFPGAQTVAYTHVAGDSAALKVGDVLVVDPDSRGLTERVTVTAVGTGTFTATFAKVHEPNSKATTAPIPYWTTGRRFLFVVVTASVLSNQRVLEKLNAYLSKVLVHAGQWAIVASSGTGTAGPFTLGSSNLGQAPIVEVTY